MGMSAGFCELRCTADRFANLGFDEPNLANRVDVSEEPPWIGSGTKAFRGTVNDLVPGWKVMDDLTRAEVTVAYQLSESDFDHSEFLGRSVALVPGNGGFAVELIGDYYSRNGVSIRQTATVPLDAVALTFDLKNNPVALWIDSERIPLAWVTPRDAALYAIGAYGKLTANVSAYAGQTVEISFTATTSNELIPDSGLYYHGVIDDVSFVVPEPSTWFMLIFGFAAFGLTLRRKKRAILL